jgi:hypothetical protein
MVEMKAATENDIAEDVMRPGKVITAVLVLVVYTPLIFHILRLQREKVKLKEWWIRRQVEKRLIVELMYILIK